MKAKQRLYYYLNLPLNNRINFKANVSMKYNVHADMKGIDIIISKLFTEKEFLSEMLVTRAFFNNFNRETKETKTIYV